MSNTAKSEGVLRLSRHPLGYVAVLMALVTGVLHIVLVSNAIQQSQMMGILFGLNGIGFLAGMGIYLTRFWQREFYLVGALYALATIVALFVFQGFGLDAFYMRGELNPMAVITKVAEGIIAVCAAYLYVEDT